MTRSHFNVPITHLYANQILRDLLNSGVVLVFVI